MILRDTLRAVLRDQHSQTPPPPEVVRTLARQLPLGDSQYALVLTGVRRCGKSTLQAQLIQHHRGALYANMEDTRLYGMGPEDFPTLIEVIEELNGGGAVFLDEIQELPEWQRLVRTLLDRGHALCLTGSNASLLHREMGAKLTGRHRSFEVFPFSYSEFLAFVGGVRGTATLADYLDHGGFAGYLRDRVPQVLQQLLRDIVERDIAQRHHVREARHVMNLVLYLLGNTGQPVSFQKLTKSLGVPTVHQTSRYMEYLQDSYLLFAVPKFSASFKQRVIAPPKYYAIDNGLRRANSPNLTADVGHLLENAVFLSLRQRGFAPCYAGEKDAWECDFVTADEAIQVCAELTPANRDRELEGLRQACALPGKRRPLVVTLNQRDRFKYAGLDVEVVPAWAWLDEATAGAHR